jgi:hypothetical protein
VHASPAGLGVAELRPGEVAEAIGVAVAAAEQVEQRLLRQGLHGVLHRRRRDRVGLAGVAHDGAGAQRDQARRRDEARTPVAEGVAIGRGLNGGLDAKMIGRFEIRDTAVVNAQRQDHRRRLRAAIRELVADLDSHAP